MTSFDTIIVGSGPAGVSAAYQLSSPRTLMLDVGYRATESNLPDGNIYDVRQAAEDLFEPLIGRRFEALHNIAAQRYLSPKLKAPLMRFITDAPDGATRFVSDSFDAVVSYARGGLANAWGAGVYRFNERELRAFPIGVDELAPYYDRLTEHIGIVGAGDDLEIHLGSTRGLQQPLPLSDIAAELMRGYERRRDAFHAKNIRVGHPRAAVLSSPLGERPAHNVANREFYEPNIRSIYHPGYTLDSLIRDGVVSYRAGKLVQRYEETESGVRVFARDLDTGRDESFEGRKLLLAAGTLNTTRIVLASNNDFETRVPILDNLVTYVPFINFRRIGVRLDTHSHASAELILIYDGPLTEEAVQATFYGLVAPLRSDLLSEFPLSVKGNVIAAKYLIPALAMLQLFYADDPAHGNTIRLREDGAVEISYAQRKFGALERHLIGAFRSLGFYSHSRLVKQMRPGASMHYAASLPMREQPTRRYETDRFGKIYGTRHVHAIDASNFSSLPSKNHTFTIMANAMRIAEHVARELTV